MKVFGGDLSQTYSLFSRLQEAKKFSGNPGHFMCVTRETRYHVWIRGILNKKSLQQVADLVRRFRAMLKILYFSGSKKILQILPGKRSLYYWGRKIIHLLTGEA